MAQMNKPYQAFPAFPLARFAGRPGNEARRFLHTHVYLIASRHIVAERLSARQLIVQCGLKSQLAYIYIYICAQLPSCLGMQLNLRLRSLYALLLCLYVPYTRCYYSCNEMLPAPGAPRGASACSRWRPDELHGCRLCTSDARRIRDLDKSITSFYPGRLTTAPT